MTVPASQVAVWSWRAPPPPAVTSVDPRMPVAVASDTSFRSPRPAVHSVLAVPKGVPKGDSPLAGGPAPFVSALLVTWMSGAPWGVACYVILLSLITAVSVWWGPETHESDLADERGVSVHAN